MASNRPQFWLQVRKDYIFDNFESLLNYLRQYNYTPHEEHPDYDSTLQCMTGLSDEIADRIFATPFYERPATGYDLVQVIRLFCATILASNKAGITPRRLVAALVDLLMKEQTDLKDGQAKSLFEIVTECIRGKEIVKCGFTWDDIVSSEMQWGLFLLKLCQMTFYRKETESPSVYIENHGLFVVPPAGISDIAVVNRVNYGKMKSMTQFQVPGFLQGVVDRVDHEDGTDFERLYQISSRLLSAQDQMNPAARRVLKEYEFEDEFIVKVVNKRGVRIEAVTIDPDYKPLRGKVWLELGEKRPGTAAFSDAISEGDYLKVNISSDPEYTFEVYSPFEMFYRNYAASQAGMKLLARYSNHYGLGTEWVTQDGLRIGIDNGKFNQLSEECKEQVQNIIETTGTLEVQLYVRPPKMDGKQFFIYAQFADIYAADKEEDTSFSIFDADREITGYFVEDCHEDGRLVEEKGRCISFEEAERELCIPLISVLAKVLDDDEISSCARLEDITATQMLCKILDRPGEFAYMDHQRRYLYSQVMFARNKDFPALVHPPVLDGCPDVAGRERIISTLRSYRKKEIALPGTDRVKSNSDVAAEVSALVSASNSLIDIIDTRQLNNIKQAIARALGVHDEYQPIMEMRTFYGDESANLEFKTSVVFPPVNRRRLVSLVRDPETQKWAIIKTVCGFLNSRSGGDLLLGVDDRGYARGLDDDIRALTEMRYISSPTPDHYRTYIQQILDFSFRVDNPKVNSTDIGRLSIKYILEENEEGKTILRIRIAPYKGKIVYILPERPEGIEESFVRISGRTVPVTPVLASEILKYKK